MSDLSTVEVLRAAKALIDTPEKWAGLDRDGLCVAQAFIRATGVQDGPTPAQRVYAETIGLDGPSVPLYEWNDSPERTHAEVMAAFDSAIAAMSEPEPVTDDASADAPS